MSFSDALKPYGKLGYRLGQSDQPADRVKANKLLRLATPEHVTGILDAVGQADRDDFTSHNDSLVNALLVLVHAADAGNEEAAAAVRDVARRLRDERPSRDDGRSAYWQALGLFRDVPAAADAFDILDAELRSLPSTPAALWAQEIGLEVPDDRRWGFLVVVSSLEAPTVDVEAHLRWAPDRSAEHHQARLAQDWWGAGADVELWSYKPVPATLPYQVTISKDGQSRTLQGTLDPAPADIRDLRRVLDTVEEQNGITFDRAKARVQGAGRLRAAKPVRDWLRAR